MAYSCVKCGDLDINCNCMHTMLALPTSVQELPSYPDTNNICMPYNPTVPSSTPQYPWLGTQQTLPTFSSQTLNSPHNSFQLPEHDSSPSHAKRNSTASATTVATTPSSDRQYACRECGKYFTHRRNRYRHERDQHSDAGEKLQCPISTCKGRVGRKDNLDKHVAYVHLECSKCGEKFAKGGEVMIHRKMDHKVDRQGGERSHTL